MTSLSEVRGRALTGTAAILLTLVVPATSSAEPAAIARVPGNVAGSPSPKETSNLWKKWRPSAQRAPRGKASSNVSRTFMASGNSSQTQSLPFTLTAPHPCTLEPVNVNGTVHVAEQTQQDGTMKIYTNTVGSGRGVVSGRHYSSSQEQHFVAEPDTSFRDYLYSKWIASGETTTLTTGDDFFVRTIIEMTFTLGVPVISLGPPQLSATCR